MANRDYLKKILKSVSQNTSWMVIEMILKKNIFSSKWFSLPSEGQLPV